MYELPEPLTYYQIVWDIVRQVPYGQVTTFGQIASMIPPVAGVEPEVYERLAPRWVGDAMNAVSRVDEPTVPWHRVINGRGMISLPDESKAAALQRARLHAENILFDAKERVDLDVFGWEGPDTAWLDANHLNAPRSLKKTPPTGPQQLNLF